MLSGIGNEILVEMPLEVALEVTLCWLDGSDILASSSITLEKNQVMNSNEL